jgi:hypothetical protein
MNYRYLKKNNHFASLIAGLLAVASLNGCGGGGGDDGGSEPDFLTNISYFQITDENSLGSDTQLSDRFGLEANFSTPDLRYVDYSVLVRLTDDLNSSLDAENSHELFYGNCLGEGDCDYNQICQIYPESSSFYIDCNRSFSETPINITNIFPSLPTTLYAEVAVCSETGCNFEYSNIPVDADRTLDDSILLIDSRNANVDTLYQSNTILISGTNTELDVVIGVGSIIKNGIELSGKSASVVQGDSVSIKLTSGSSNGISSTARLTIGDSVLEYSVITGNEFSEDYVHITDGKYSKTDVNYYYLTMPEAGNIDLSTTSRSSYTIFDMDLSKVYRSSSDGTYSLAKGSYILKTDNRNSSDEVTIYSPVFEGAENLPEFGNGTYDDMGVNYYLLRMSEAGNVELSTTSRSSYTIFDMNLKKLLRSSGDETYSLPKGSYIFKTDNRNSDDRVTIYSPSI